MLRKENSLNKLGDSAKQVNRWQEKQSRQIKRNDAKKISTRTEWRDDDKNRKTY